MYCLIFVLLTSCVHYLRAGRLIVDISTSTACVKPVFHKKECDTEDDWKLNLDCAANAVRFALAASKASNETYKLCREPSESTTDISEVSQWGNARAMMEVMMQYVSVETTMSRIERASLIDDSEGWKMRNIKGEAAGGKSDAQLYRSENKALWLKTLSRHELETWRTVSESYAEHMLATLPHTLLVRILGVFTIGEADCSKGLCWLTMLDVVPNGAARIPGLTCDVKPHALSANPTGYRSLDKCGAFLHFNEFGAKDTVQFATSVELLATAYQDLCWLSSKRFVDFSWLFVQAAEGALGAFNVKGTWWHVAIIDFFIGFGWESHGLRGLGRRLESEWKRLDGLRETMPQLPHGYGNQIWVDPAGYAEGKFTNYPIKQFDMFQAFVACPAMPLSQMRQGNASGSLQCDVPSSGITNESTSQDPWSMAREAIAKHLQDGCQEESPSPNVTPFLPVEEGIGATYFEQRRKICSDTIWNELQRYYEHYRNRFPDIGTNFAVRNVYRSKAKALARPRQEELLRRQFSMKSIECIWEGHNIDKCITLDKSAPFGIAPDAVKIWYAEGCLNLDTWPSVPE